MYRIPQYRYAFYPIPGIQSTVVCLLAAAQDRGHSRQGWETLDVFAACRSNTPLGVTPTTAEWVRFFFLLFLRRVA